MYSKWSCRTYVSRNPFRTGLPVSGSIRPVSTAPVCLLRYTWRAHARGTVGRWKM